MKEIHRHGQTKPTPEWERQFPHNHLCAVMCGEESLTLLLPKHSIVPEHKEHFSAAVIIKKHGEGWNQKQQACIVQ